MDELMKQEIRQLIKRELGDFIKGDRFVFDKNLQVIDGKNIQVGKTTGTSFGTEAAQKTSVYGVTPVVQAGAIAAPSGGATQDAESRTAINLIRTAIKNFGITA